MRRQQTLDAQCCQGLGASIGKAGDEFARHMESADCSEFYSEGGLPNRGGSRKAR